uniref:Uncharacterized protein n=1 Tax=Oreochromis niloticus TaxID=8128 RepID=A0A669D661_ORENI
PRVRSKTCRTPPTPLLRSGVSLCSLCAYETPTLGNSAVFPSPLLPQHWPQLSTAQIPTLITESRRRLDPGCVPLISADCEPLRSSWRCSNYRRACVYISNSRDRKNL